MQLPALSLDCLTLTDSSPFELIDCAHFAGFDLVSLWVHSALPYPRQAVGSAVAGDCIEMLSRLRIQVHSLDAVELASLDSVRSALPALEIGARLGGKVVLAYQYSNHDFQGTAEALGLLAELAAEFGLGVNLEPVAFGPTSSVEDANRLIAASGADVGILFDTYHFVRGGGKPEELSAMDRSRIRYVQVNDGLLHREQPEWLEEATQARLYPGEGEFPLAEILSLLPRHVPWGVEAPRLDRLRAGVTRQAQALDAMHAIRATLDLL